MSEDWLEITLQAARSDVEPLEDWLFEAGALSVTLRDSDDDDDIAHAVLEPVPGEVRLWEQVTLVGLFSRDTSPEALHDALALSAAITGIAMPGYTLSQLGDQDWERTWLDNFRPMQFGEHFWICPVESQAPDSQATILRLDPGLAFGTGTHATTAQCLAWMGERTAASRRPFDGLSVVDYGCGSGVLAIGALLLGADTAWAVDIDEQALQATRANAEQNGVLDRLQVGQPELVSLVQADILFANILFKPLMELADSMANGLVAGGQLILSGILEEQMEPLKLRYDQCFEFEASQVRDGWAMMSAIRR